MSEEEQAQNNPEGQAPNPEEQPPAIAANIPPRPPRPLTCYGIFSVLERNFIWQQKQKQSTSDNSAADPYAATRPERYRGLVLPPNWYVAGMNRKRRGEHVIHGKITFQQMSKVIAEKWRTVDAETRAYCEMIADDELERHKREVAEFKERYGEEAFRAATSTRRESSPKSHSKRKTSGKKASKKISHVISDVNCDMIEINSQGERLSDYLPDDTMAALALVGNNEDNILSGDELDRMFESDDDSYYTI